MALFLASSGASAQNYGKEVSKTWKQVLEIKKQDGEYRWSGYPVDNFGLATFYDPPDPKKGWKDSDRICATWTCLGLKDNVPTNETDRLGLNGYAEVGKGSDVSLTTEQQKKLGIGLVLPSLAQVLKLNAALNWQKGVTTTLKLGPVAKRSVDRDKLRQFISSSDNKNQTLKDAFAAGRLSYIAADIVATSIDLTIAVDKKANNSVALELDKAAAALPKGASLKWEMTSDGKGNYHLVTTHPVIIAVQTRAQPGGGQLTSGGSDEAGAGVAAPRASYQNGWPVEKIQ